MMQHIVQPDVGVALQVTEALAKIQAGERFETVSIATTQSSGPSSACAKRVELATLHGGLLAMLGPAQPV
jgi:hypothetical protein